MKRVVRRVIDRKGRVRVIDLPEPHFGPNQMLVRSAYSLISSGTELRTLSKTPVELARQTISDPWMRYVVKHTVFSTGVAQTGSRIWHEMLALREIGYSGAGTVLAVGDHVEGFRVGDTVAYAATGHAETAAPMINHVARVPSDVELRHAAFVTVGAIALHSLRRAEVQLGETIAVYGLGLVGQLCAMLAKVAGCTVVGIDVNDQRIQLATANGADAVINPEQVDLQRRIMDLTDKQGVDATIICASSHADDIINSSIEMTRRQGRVVVLGYVGMNASSKHFFLREIDLRYSRAYGPGSYHSAYEKGHIDYPFGYVRWTEKRNLQAFVDCLKSGRLNLDSLIGGTYSIDRAQEAFADLQRGTLRGVAALIAYDGQESGDRRRTLTVRSRRTPGAKIGVAVVGCGNQVLGKHLPNLHAMPDVELRAIVSATGKNAAVVAERYGAAIITTDLSEVLNDPDTDAVMVCSSQPEHSGHLKEVIPSGKAVFVEKPMVTRLEDFREICRLMAGTQMPFTLGLNRRYSSLVQTLRESIVGPVDAVTYTVASPFIAPDHWSLDPFEGGGRLITEGEHFIDLCHLLVGRTPRSVYAHALGTMPDDLRTLARFAVTIHYEEAVAYILFSETGAKGHPRERVAVYGRGQVAILDNFTKLSIHGTRVQTFGGGWRADMGHKQELGEFIAAIQGKPNKLLTWEDASAATLCMFAAQESIRSGQPVDLREFKRAVCEETAHDQDAALAAGWSSSGGDDGGN